MVKRHLTFVSRPNLEKSNRVTRVRLPNHVRRAMSQEDAEARARQMRAARRQKETLRGS